MTFIRWCFRVLKKGVWILGFLPQLLDYISTYVPPEYIPAYIWNLLEKGGNWQLTLVLVGIGLFVSAFLVHLETKQALDERDLRIRELEDKQPRIVVGFQDSVRHLVERLELQLNPLPQKPDFDALVEEKRKELLAERPSSRSMPDVLAAIASASLNRANPNYEKEVEQYLIEYRDYLVRAYECTVDRAYAIYPIVENRGHHPASSVTIEFTMPAAYKKPAEHQCFDRSAISNEDLDFYLLPPPEPKPFIGWLYAFDTVAMPDLSDSILSRIELASNISGPIHEEREGVHYVEYKVERLVQHCPEDDFEPFWLWLADIDHSTVWEIPVRITSADLHKAQEEILLLDIRVVESGDETDSSE